MPIEKTPNFIRIRVENPAQFSRFRVKELGNGIKAVIGFMAKGGSKIQSILFPRSSFTLATAKAWISKHGYHVAETQAYWVYDVLFDSKLDIYFEETVATEEDEVPHIDVKKMTNDEFAWLVS